MPNDSSTAGTQITLRDFGKAFRRPTDDSHNFILKKFQGHVLDVEDVHFHFDSAVLLPDFGDYGESADAADQNRITGLMALAAAYRHAEAHADQKMLIAGHTDREGREGYNLGLSRLRANNVLHLLEGSRGDWVDVCLQKHKVGDYQQILKWLRVAWSWECDPGSVDDALGPKTRAALRSFQAAYNGGKEPLPDGFTARITVDGVVGKQTWGAFFDVYLGALKLLLDVDDGTLRSMQGAFTFVDASRKTVGCGEHHPITKNPVVDHGRMSEKERQEVRRLARVDRRVEILFFDPGEEPRLAECHPEPTRCAFGKCEIYDPSVFKLDPLPYEPLASPEGTIRIRLLDRFGEPHRMTSCDVEVPGLGTIQATSDDKGWIRIKCPKDADSVDLSLDGVGEGEGRRRVLLKPTAGDDAKGTKQRLANLGFSGEEDAVQRFWRAHTLEPSETKLASDLDDIESKCKTLDDPSVRDTGLLDRQVHGLGDLGERT